MNELVYNENQPAPSQTLRKRINRPHKVLESVHHSVMFDSATPWTVAHQAPLTMAFSRQEYWSGLLFPPPGDGTEPGSPALQANCLPSEPSGKPHLLNSTDVRNKEDDTELLLLIPHLKN